MAVYLKVNIVVVLNEKSEDRKRHQLRHLETVNIFTKWCSLDELKCWPVIGAYWWVKGSPKYSGNNLWGSWISAPNFNHKPSNSCWDIFLKKHKSQPHGAKWKVRGCIIWEPWLSLPNCKTLHSGNLDIKVWKIHPLKTTNICTKCHLVHFNYQPLINPVNVVIIH